MRRKNVLLIGASGMLGSNIVEALIADGNYNIRALLREGKPAFAKSLNRIGVQPVLGDALRSTTLVPAMRNVDVVISALGNDTATFVSSHRNLIEAAEVTGVSRLIPSDFSIELFKLDVRDNLDLAMRKKVASLFDGKTVRPIHVLNGAFMETLLDRNAPFVDWDRKVLPFFGDTDQKCDFTSIADVAKFVAAICRDEEAPEIVRISGDELTMPELAESITNGFGERFAADRRGSLEDLEQLIEEKKKTALHAREWRALQYHHNLVSGRGKLDLLDNSRYPSIKPLSVASFTRIQRRNAVNLFGSTMESESNKLGAGN